MRSRGSRWAAAGPPHPFFIATRALDKSSVLRAGIGIPIIDAVVKLKMDDWADYARHLTEWERERTLDC